MAVELGPLKLLMQFHLKSLDDEDRAADDDTIHKDRLSEDGLGNASTKNIYKIAIVTYLTENDAPNNQWPDDWMDLSVAQLAPQLLS